MKTNNYQKEFLKAMREIRSLCEEGGWTDKTRVDKIHRFADDWVYTLTHPT